MAEEIATLDVLSNGRVEFGVGRGSIPTHFSGFGLNQSESRERMLEGLGTDPPGLDKDRVSFHGRFWNVDNISVVPKPVQRPHPPVRFATNSIDSFELFGRMGEPICVAAQVNRFRIREFLPLYRQARQAAGHPDHGGEDVTLLMPLYVGESQEQIRQELEPSISHFLERLQRSMSPLGRCLRVA